MRNYYEFEPIGSRVRKARKDKGLIQDKLSELLNISSKHLSEIERSISGLSLSVLMGINEYLDTSADYILYGKVSDDANNPFNSILKQLTPSQIMTAEKMLELYAESCKRDRSK